jgi:hypothetical protein
MQMIKNKVDVLNKNQVFSNLTKRQLSSKGIQPNFQKDQQNGQLNLN